MCSVLKLLSICPLIFAVGGDNTLETACRGKDLEPEEVLCKLQWIENLKKEQVADLDSLTPAQLKLHIESKHHEYLKKFLPGNRNLLDLRFYLLREDLEPHLLKEEMKGANHFNFFTRSWSFLKRIRTFIFIKKIMFYS